MRAPKLGSCEKTKRESTAAITTLIDFVRGGWDSSRDTLVGAACGRTGVTASLERHFVRLNGHFAKAAICR